MGGVAEVSTVVVVEGAGCEAEVVVGGDLMSSGPRELYCVGVKEVASYVGLSKVISCCLCE